MGLGPIWPLISFFYILSIVFILRMAFPNAAPRDKCLLIVSKEKQDRNRDDIVSGQFGHS